LETLEDRTLLSAGLQEQYDLYLLNRMRTDPADELPILLNSTGPNVQNALTFWGVDRQLLAQQWATLTPAPPVAWSDILAGTALAHSSLMSQFDTQSHQLPGESDLGTRFTQAFGAAGLIWSNAAENVFTNATSIFEAHAAFAIDWGPGTGGVMNPPGHRNNIMNPLLSLVGVGLANQQPGHVNGPLLITEDYASVYNGGPPYLVGVAYSDTNGNGFYDPGEGLSGVTVSVSGANGTFTTTTTATGGYQLQLPAGTYTATFSGGFLGTPRVQPVTIGTSNVLLNVAGSLASPSAVYASFVPSTSILAINELFAGPRGTGASLTISGNTGPGGGPTSMITVAASMGTTVNGGNAITVTMAFPGAISAINVSLLNDNDSLTLGTPTGIINLPSTNLNVTVGGGNDTLVMGTAGSALAPAVHNTLGGVTWTAANLSSTGTESVSILNAAVGSISIQENGGPGDAIQLWGVTAAGSTTLAQSNGAGDTISVDQLNTTNPGTPTPTGSLISSTLGTLRTAQGDGSNDNTTVNRTAVGVSLSATQGNGAGDTLLLGPGDTVGTAVASVFNGPAQLTQGSGNGDYLGLANLQAGATTLLQQDVAANQTGDTVGGVTAPAIPPGGNGLDSSSPTVTANLVTANNSTTALRTVPTNGLAGAVFEQLNITQGSAGSDLVALVQLPAVATTGASLRVVGGSGIPGTLTIQQQDPAGGRGDFVFLGSYIPGSGTFTSQSPPFPYTPGTVGAIGSIIALNEVVTQGNAAGDVLSVLFNSLTSSASQVSSLFTQGNGADQAIFQEDGTATGGSLNYVGGSGGNRVQADSNGAAGIIDGGSTVPNNHLAQDNQNPLLRFIDFGDVTFA
jgi:hypothetical protein